MKLLSFDVGATLIKYGIVDDQLNITNRGTVPTPKESFESFSGLIYDVYQQCRDEVEGIAMALPGVVDAETGYCVGSNIMRYEYDRHVAKVLGEICGCKVTIDNDAKAAVQAEFHKGALQGCQNAAVFVIGTGIGGGLVINGQIVRGPHFTAGEFSFINTEANNINYPYQILGECCSTTYLLRTYKERTNSEEQIDGREFFRRMPDDPIAQEIFDQLCTNIAVQLYNMYYMLDLEKVAIGGGISAQPIVVERIREKFEEVRLASYTGGGRKVELPVEIVNCQFRNDANLIGACITWGMK